MKAFLVVLLGIAGLASAHVPYMIRAAGDAEYDAFCTDASSSSYTVPHPTNCSEFLVCSGTSAKVAVCLDNKWYDEFSGACLSRNISSCAHIPSGIPNYVLELCATLPVGQSIPAESCNRYYVCYGDRAFELSCPNGQHYSRAYSACMNPLLAGCRSLNTMCLGEYTGFAFPSLTCSEYYICKETQLPELATCEAGLYFSADQQKCTDPDSSGCVENPSVTTPDTPGCATVPSPTCTAENTGDFFQHPDCNWFYMCYNSVAVEIQCLCGQYFNPTKLYCEEDVDHVCS